MGRLPLQGCRQTVLLPRLCFLFAAALAFPQRNEINYNTYYRFPLSLGVEYQSLSPFAVYGSQYNLFELSANLRWPIPSEAVVPRTDSGECGRHLGSAVSRAFVGAHLHEGCRRGAALAFPGPRKPASPGEPDSDGVHFLRHRASGRGEATRVRLPRAGGIHGEGTRGCSYCSRGRFTSVRLSKRRYTTWPSFFSVKSFMAHHNAVTQLVRSVYTLFDRMPVPDIDLEAST